jgi:FtsP/CotA-like multicopper oxidase with cupredoxin domain
MSSGGSPYVVPPAVESDAIDPAVFEVELVASRIAGVDLGLGPGLTANIETFNGLIPGPVFKLNVDDTVVVRLINELDHPTGIHWHGIELANSADGTEVTQEPVGPILAPPPPPPAPIGGSYLYKFTVTRPGLYWYHPHHHASPNRVFRGLYGMIVVADPLEAGLVGTVLPAAADTYQVVLSDITVCKAINDIATYPDPTPMPAADRPEWLSGNTAQPAPAPRDLCEVAFGATDDLGAAALVNFAAGDVPSIIRAPGRINEGQTVLTNGVNVGPRPGTPDAPGTLPATSHALDVLSGQGLRLQIVNCATTRYFRLRLTDHVGTKINLVRIGGEGGLLDAAILEGDTVGTYVTKYDEGEILIPPSSRADIVAAIPAGLPVDSKLTMWTRDFPRIGPVGNPNSWADLPTVPVMHLNVTGAAGVAYTLPPGTALRPPADLVEALPAATGTLLTPTGGFVPPKQGMASQDIKFTGGAVDGVNAHFEAIPYTNNAHVGSTRYAEAGRLLQLTITNQSGAHHPFHLHGFSFQPISLAPRAMAPPGTPTGTILTWPHREFLDTIDIPAHYTLTIRVRLDGDRPLLDGSTIGGSLGRWLFHCHIFFHHHHGMMSELVVGAADGKEKPNIDVRGSWAYAPIPGIARRSGTFASLDDPVTSVTVSPPGLGTVTMGAGTWQWEYDTTGVAPFAQFVYITASDGARLDQAVFRLKVGAPDDGADNGDPHIRTVDGKYYDFQAVGEFTLLRDTEGLEIQARQTPVPTATPITDGNTGLKTCVSVNTAVAARIGAHRISFQPVGQGDSRPQLFLDGKRAELSERGLDFEEGRVSAYPYNGATAVRVDYANQTVLTATPYSWNSNNIWILNISVSHTNADRGIMGRIPPQTWLPLLPSGASVGPKPADLHERYIALYKTFANAWRVTDQTSLFVYAPGTSAATFTDVDWPAEKPPCEQVKPGFAILGANPPLEGIKVETAEKLCKLVTIDDLHRGCVFDVATTGDKALVQNYLQAQELRLKGTAVQIVSDKPRSRAGEAVVFTAIVSTLTSGKREPAGTITFFVDDVPAEKPIEIGKGGRAVFKTAGLSTGVRRVRAAFTATGEDPFHDSSSPSLRHPVDRRSAVDRGNAPYRLRGMFYEACDCFTVCPCWLGNNPDGGECTGVFAWDIGKGTIDGVDVSGLRAVSVSHHTGSRDEAEQRVVIFIDDHATRQQADALAAAFTGRLGGPLKELAELLGELAAVERAPITLRREGRLTTLVVDHRIHVDGATNEGPSGRSMALNDGRLSKVLGTPAAIGESGRFRIGLRGHGMDVDLRGRSTMSGYFYYVHDPTQDSRGTRGHAGGSM